MRKGTKNLIIAAAAVFAAALLACLIVLAALPAGTGARYAEDEMYSGVVANDGNSSHTHSGWTAITGSMTITLSASATVNYYLTEDVTGDIKIETSATSSSNAPVVNICLNGHALTGTGSGSVITIGSPTETSNKYYVTVNLYDCGGESTWNRHYYRYLYEDDDAVVDGEPFPTRYDFSLTDDEIKDGEYDGCVRGGLITGGNATSEYYGGGVTVGYYATLNMYGGTIAGNMSDDEGGGLGVHNGYIYLYGGSIEGNHGHGGGAYVNNGGSIYLYGGEIKNNYSTSGGGVRFGTYTPRFYMYGGIISGNYSAGNGGGLSVSGRTGQGGLAEIHGGTISGNYAKDRGGGIYSGNYTNTYLYGGTITGNRAEESGGGLCLGGTTTVNFRIHGTPYVNGNYAAGKISNLDMNYGGHESSTNLCLTINGDLEEGARIGITASNLSDSYRITGNSSDYDLMAASARYFFSDDPNYGIELASSSSSYYLRFYKKSA